MNKLDELAKTESSWSPKIGDIFDAKIVNVKENTLDLEVDGNKTFAFFPKNKNDKQPIKNFEIGQVVKVKVIKIKTSWTRCILIKW